MHKKLLSWQSPDMVRFKKRGTLHGRGAYFETWISYPCALAKNFECSRRERRNSNATELLATSASEYPALAEVARRHILGSAAIQIHVLHER